MGRGKTRKQKQKQKQKERKRKEKQSKVKKEFTCCITKAVIEAISLLDQIVFCLLS
jgi:hypothetical protein